MRSSGEDRVARGAWSLLVLVALIGALTVTVVAPADRVAAASEYVALSSPRRLVDTRPGAATFDGRDAGVGLRPAGSTMVVQVTDRAGVPADASSVVLNVTAVAPLDAGHLIVYPSGTTRPNASNVNHAPGQTIANTVIARVGDDGAVSVYTFAATHLVVDISGHFPTGTDSLLPAPRRLVDTRPGAATFDGRDAGVGLRRAGSTMVVQVTDRAGVPADASSVVLNVTAVAPLNAGHLIVSPSGTTRPNASNVNHAPGQTIANTVIARVGDDGSVLVYTHAATHLVVDIAGQLPTDTYTALPVPQRLADTRPGAVTADGQQEGTGLVPGGNSLQLHVARRAGIPTDASAVVLNVTAVAPHGAGHVTVHSSGTERPNASNVNHGPGQTIANTVIARLGAGGDVCVFTHATTHLVIDVAGYLTGPPPPPAGPICPPGPLPTWGPPEPTTGDSITSARSFAASDLGVVAVRPSATDGPPAATTVSFSTDGQHWDEVADIDGVRFWTVIAGGPGFVAVGHEDTDDIGYPTSAGVLPLPVPAVWTSADGTTWLPSAISAAPFEYGRVDSVAVTASGGFVAAGSAWNGSGAAIFGQIRPMIWTSPNGLSWTLVGDPFGPVPEYVRTTVAAGAGGTVAIVTPYPDEGATGPVSVWWSPDGLTWTAAAPIDSFGFGRALPLDAVAFEFGFVMVGFDWADAGTPYVWSSPDGLTWSDPLPLPFGPPADAAFLSGVSTDGTALVAFGDDVEYSPGTGPAIGRASMWMSADASNWVQVPAAALDVPGSIEPGFIKVALPFDDGWIACGQGSVDGADSELVWRSI